MKKFRFRFKTLETVRKRLEDMALMNLAQTQKLLQDEKQRREALIARMNESLERREALATAQINIEAYRVETSFIEGQKQRIIQAEQMIYQAEKHVQEAHEKYLEMRKKRMTLEKIKEKDLQAFKKEQNRLDQKRTDDMNSARDRLNREEAA